MYMCEVQYIMKFFLLLSILLPFGEKGFVLISLNYLNEGDFKIGSNCIDSGFGVR